MVRTDGFGITSVNTATPDRLWVSDDGVAWSPWMLPAGFVPADASRSRELVAVAGTVERDGRPALALATARDPSQWTVTALDVDGFERATNEGPAVQVAVSGSRVVAAVRGRSDGPAPGGSLVFTGDGGPPYRRYVDSRFSNAQLSVGAQYVWWVAQGWTSGEEPISTIYGPAPPPTGSSDSSSTEPGWETFGRISGDVRHLGGRDAGEEYFEVNSTASPGSVRSVLRLTDTALDDDAATAAFGGLRWMRQCCNNQEPSVGVGEAGVVALATDEPLGLTPTPDLSRLVVAASPNGADWSLQSVGAILPEKDLDVTQLIALRDRFLVVVTDRYPQPDGTNPAIVLVGTID